MNRTYEIVCHLAPQAALKRIGALLSREGVRYSSVDLAIASSKTPFAVLGLDPRMYTRSNWVGINPFAFVSGLNVSCEPVDGRSTKVRLQIHRRRAVLWFAFWVVCGFFVARALPAPGGAIFFVALACVAWLGNVSFLGGYLIRKEIETELMS